VIYRSERKTILKDPLHFPPGWAGEWGYDTLGYWAVLMRYDNSHVFRWIPPEQFMMGSPDNEPARENDEVQHEVTLTHGFWLAETACTQTLWVAVMGENPSAFKGYDRPVDSVSWEDTQTFLKKLNEMVPDAGFGLPTEAEWEYACRAGTTTPFSFGGNITTDQVNFNGKYPYANGPKGKGRGATVPVKCLPPNPWGLYEMHGNIWEWCSDWYEAEYDCNNTVNPEGPDSGDDRVLRGGGWITSGRNCRSASRFARHPASRNRNIGFRLSRGHQTG
jgi:formylglycine-generating enzyme